MNRGILWALAGAALGYYVAWSRLEKGYYEKLNKAEDDSRDFYKKQFEKKFKEKVAELEADHENRIGRISNAMTDAVIAGASDEEIAALATEQLSEPEKEDIRTAVEELVVEEAESILKEPADQALINYGAYSGPSVIDTEKFRAGITEEREADAEEDEGDTAEAEYPKPTAQYPQSLIDGDEFMRNANGWTQIPMTYYAGDDSFVTASDSKVQGTYRTNLLGVPVEEWMRRSWEGGPDVIYVRVPQKQLEYEIFWNPRSLTEDLNEG